MPEEKLLLIKTSEIRSSFSAIASFLQISDKTLNYSHLYKGSNKFNLLNQIDKDFLREKIMLHCEPIMREVFPEIKI